MLTHPVGYASYAVPVRQYRYLQSGLLQCMDHSKPPRHLLMFPDVTPAHKRLSLSGFLISKSYIYHSGHTQSVWHYGGRTLEQSPASHYCTFVRAWSSLFSFCFLHLHPFAIGLKFGLKEHEIPQQRQAGNRCLQFQKWRFPYNIKTWRLLCWWQQKIFTLLEEFNFSL